MESERSSEGISFLPAELEDLRRQQTAFCVLTLFVLAMLLLLHSLFAYVLGEPSLPVLAVLGGSFALRLGELIWLQDTRSALNLRKIRADGLASILMLFGLAALLAWLTNRDHSPYQVLLAIPVLQSAFLFGLTATVCTVVAADGGIFLWLWRYFSLHPPPSGAEYLEGGMLAVVYALMGLLVWLLVSQLRNHQRQLSAAVSDLETAKAHLVREEKLAAVGRFASGIAHEIRNPVAMIVSALSTATDRVTETAEREEMFAIAARQASRLESLTTEFLTYARPIVPRRAEIWISELTAGVVDVARMRGSELGVEVHYRVETDRIVTVDAAQIEGALLNLTLNAIDATTAGGTITVTAGPEADALRIDIEDSGAAIPAADLDRIFEPFFTTKQGGTGLGLAIARGVAEAHGGDLRVSRNEEGHVVFTMTVSTPLSQGKEQEVIHG